MAIADDQNIFDNKTDENSEEYDSAFGFGDTAVDSTLNDINHPYVEIPERVSIEASQNIFRNRGVGEAAQKFDDVFNNASPYHSDFVYSGGFVTSNKSADFDANGEVGFGDFFLFADAFGSSDSTFDLNNDSIVNLSDFFLFADNFGTAPQPAIEAIMMFAQDPEGENTYNSTNPYGLSSVE